MKPTVGRKVWYWSGRDTGDRFVDGLQPFDATVLCVHPDTTVNLNVITHEGHAFFKEKVELREPRLTDSHATRDFGIATWMPYQVGQAKKQEENAQ